MLKKLIDTILKFLKIKKVEKLENIISEEDFKNQLLNKTHQKKSKLNTLPPDDSLFDNILTAFKGEFSFLKAKNKMRDLIFKSSRKHEKIPFKKVELKWKELKNMGE